MIALHQLALRQTVKAEQDMIEIFGLMFFAVIRKAEIISVIIMERVNKGDIGDGLPLTYQFITFS
jgi:hypothetical protein